jgi:hypothetical protein
LLLLLFFCSSAVSTSFPFIILMRRILEAGVGGVGVGGGVCNAWVGVFVDRWSAGGWWRQQRLFVASEGPK